MTMDEGEIIREYKAAKNKKDMVQVLADRNCIKRKDMAQWLAEHGQEVDKRLLAEGRKPDKPKDTLTMSEPTMITMPIDKIPATISNQTAKADAGKPRLSLVPMQILFDIAEIREYGNRKYPNGGSDNWKQVEPERYREALLRHILRYIDDPDGVDDESGLPHLWHAACNMAFLAELEKAL